MLLLSALSHLLLRLKNHMNEALCVCVRRVRSVHKKSGELQQVCAGVFTCVHLTLRVFAFVFREERVIPDRAELLTAHKSAPL